MVGSGTVEELQMGLGRHIAVRPAEIGRLLDNRVGEDNIEAQ